jgi:hypothetical protein
MTKGLLKCTVLATAFVLTVMQASAEEVTLRGSGSCQEYLDARRNSLQEAVKDLTWFMGYMSGLAAARQVNVLKAETGPESMVKWVDIYCQAYPAKYLSDAGNLYYRFLNEQMKTSQIREEENRHVIFR